MAGSMSSSTHRLCVLIYIILINTGPVSSYTQALRPHLHSLHPHRLCAINTVVCSHPHRFCVIHTGCLSSSTQAVCYPHRPCVPVHIGFVSLSTQAVSSSMQALCSSLHRLCPHPCRFYVPIYTGSVSSSTQAGCPNPHRLCPYPHRLCPHPHRLCPRPPHDRTDGHLQRGLCARLGHTLPLLYPDGERLERGVLFMPNTSRWLGQPENARPLLPRYWPGYDVN